MTMTHGAQITATLTPEAQPPASMERELDDYLSLLGPTDGVAFERSTGVVADRLAARS
jgi:hypothetical protein